MFDAIDISTSGLVAQRVRLNTVAMNIAGADLVYDATEGGPYKRRAVIFAEGMNGRDRGGEGVHVASIEKQSAYRYVHDPGHPLADGNGNVKMPDIDPIVEMVNGMEAQRAYEANLAAIDLSKAMLNSSVRLLG